MSVPRRAREREHRRREEREQHEPDGLWRVACRELDVAVLTPFECDGDQHDRRQQQRLRTCSVSIVRHQCRRGAMTSLSKTHSDTMSKRRDGINAEAAIQR
jgi:hypothetical protein